MLRDEVASVFRVLVPGRTNPRNCLESTLVFNGCDPAFLQSCYDRPGVGVSPILRSLPRAAFHVRPHILAAVDKLVRDDGR